MANQMIALQAKAPDMPSFTDYIQIREHAQDRQNAMLKQQQEQNAMLRKQAEADAMNNAYGQALDPATGRIDANKLSGLLAQGGFGSSIPGVQQELSKAQGEQTKTSAAQLEHLMKFSKASRSEFGNAASPEDALGRAQRLAQAFPDMAPHLQAGLADMPKDPAGFAAWKQDVLRKNLTAEQQLKQHFFKIEDATGQHILSVPEVGGAARIVEGSRTSSAPKTQFVWGANGGQVIDTSKPGPVMDGGGGPASVDSLLPAIVQQESRGNYGAVNSSTGAMGAYQVMPATGKSLADQLGLPWRPDLMTSPSPAGRQYQDQIGKAAVAEAVAASGGDVGTAAAYYHGGSDRAKWGPKTRQYAQEVAARVGGGGQLKPPPTADERAANGPGKPIPASVLNKGEAEFEIFSSLLRANTTWNPQYAGNTITGGAETLAQRVFGEGVGTPGQAEWWADFRSTDNLIRNNMFGSALTDGEKAAYKATTIDETTDPKIAAQRLNKRGDIITGALRRKARTLVANGYNIDAVREMFGNEPMIVGDLDTVRSGAQPAQAATPPAANSGWGTAKVVGGR